MKRLAFILCLFLSAVAQGATYDAWTYYRSLTDGNSTAISNFVVRVSITLNAAHVNANASDVRVYDVTDGVGLPYWLESYNSGTGAIVLFFKATNTNHTHRIYYGKSDATSASSGSTTFPEFYDFESGFGYNDATFANAASPLTTPTYDGSGEAVHPGIVDFGAGGSGGTWNGYRYWLANTPYPGSDNSKENPSMLVSNDNSTWVVPPGLTNPIIAKPANGFNYDPDIVYNPVTNELWLYFGQRINTTEWLYLTKSTDGVNWTTPVSLLTWPTSDDTRERAWGVIRKSATDWKLIACTDVNVIVTRTSSDGVTWSAPTNASVSPSVASLSPWHIHALWSSALNLYIAVFSPNGGDLWCITSPDWVNWTSYTYQTLYGSPGLWDARPYRPAVSVDGSTLRLWYSAYLAGTPNVWHIGYSSLNLSRFVDAQASPFYGWTGTSDRTKWYRSSTQAKRGSSSGALNVNVTLSKTVSSTNGVYYEFDFYDDGTPTVWCVRLYNATNNLGLGVRTSTSATKYITHTKASSTGTATSVDRSNGWHKGGILVKSDSSVVYYIDDAQVATASSQFNDVATIRMATNLTNPVYIDDIRIRTFASTEPSITAGSETPNTPTAPSSLSANAVSSTQINLTWTDNASNETSFTVSRFTDAGLSANQTDFTGIAADSTSYSDTTCAAGTQYWYVVKAVNGAGSSSPSSSANATTLARRTAPRMVFHGDF